MNTYINLTNEELVDRISAGEEIAYEQLFRNLRPVILHEAAMYLNKMETYSLEDLVQEGNTSPGRSSAGATGAEEKDALPPTLAGRSETGCATSGGITT